MQNKKIFGMLLASAAFAAMTCTSGTFPTYSTDGNDETKIQKLESKIGVNPALKQFVANAYARTEEVFELASTEAATTTTAVAETSTTTSTTTTVTTTETTTTSTETTTTTTEAPVTEPETEATTVSVSSAEPEEEKAEGDNSFWANSSKYVLDYDGLYYEYTADDDYLYFNDITISRRDYILLCNCVGWEYGSYYVPLYERSLVCEVIFNRINSPRFPSDLYSVITQRYQFSGSGNYADADHFVKDGGSQAVQDAVCTYLYNMNSDTYYNEGYLFFSGDGYWNYFRQQ